MDSSDLSAKDRAEIELAREKVEAASFTIELDRPIPEGHEIFVVGKVGTNDGKHTYRVIFSDPKSHWF